MSRGATGTFLLRINMQDSDKKIVLNLFEKNFIVQLKKGSREITIKSANNNRYFSRDEVARAIVSKIFEYRDDIVPKEITGFVNKIIDLKEQDIMKTVKPATPKLEIFNTLFEEVKEEYGIVTNDAMTKITCSSDGITKKQADLESIENYMKSMAIAKEYDIRDGEISTLLKAMVQKAGQDHLANLFKNIRHEEGHDKNAEECLRGMYNHFGISDDYDIFKTIMYHWIWQVKRKMLGLEIRWPIWPHFYGAAGIGKTKTLEKMIDSAIPDFRTTTQLAKLFESTSEVKRMTEYYAWVIDELAVGKSAEETADGCLTNDQKSILKSMLTSTDIDARIYCTQNMMKRDLTFSCISSANVHFADVIFDEQTMRRYFEFTCTAKKPESEAEWTKRMYFTQYFMDLWLDVDENIEKGYLHLGEDEIGRKVDEIQCTYFPTNTTVARWLTVYDIKPGQSPQADIHRMYVDWCKESGYSKFKNIDNFIKELKHRRPDLIDQNGFIFGLVEAKKESLKPTEEENLLDKVSFTEDGEIDFTPTKKTRGLR